MRRILGRSNGLASRLVAGGRRTARQCTIDAAARAEARLVGRAVEA
jgi:hypothetical protein